MVWVSQDLKGHALGSVPLDFSWLGEEAFAEQGVDFSKVISDHVGRLASVPADGLTNFPIGVGNIELGH